MSSEYEKQLEEANQRLREQLEIETARADKLEKKLKENEWRGLKDVNDATKAYKEKVMKDMYEKINKPHIDITKKYNEMYNEFIATKKNKF